MPGVLQSIYGGLTGAGTANEQTAFNRDLQEGDDSQVQGGALQKAGTGLQTQFGSEYLNQNNLQGGYRGQADTAYGDLAANPGYSATDRAAIQGNPNAAFQYYNPTQLEGDTSDYAGNLDRAAQQGQQYLQAAPTNQTNWQGGINKNLESSGSDAVSGLESGVGSAVHGLGTNLQGYELSPEEAQNIRNVAAQTTQGQYGKMSQQAVLQAEAQGNTSPAALAAIQENLGRQGAIDAGNAASSAELAANQAAAERKLTGATTLYGAQSNAANQIYGAKQGTAANQAATETQANESIAANQGTAANAEANLGYNAAQTGGAQKIATDTGLQTTGQNLATGADQSASNRATTTANQTKTDQNSVRNYYTGEQGAAQTGAATAGNEQLSAYGGTTSAYGAQQGAVNNANAAAGNVAVGANSTSQNLDRSLLADGGTVTGPTVTGYDDTTLPKPHRDEVPDISHDYREQINTDPIPVSNTYNSTTNNSLNPPNNSTPPVIFPVGVGGATSSGGTGGGGGEINPTGSGYGGGVYSTIGNPGWGGYSGGSTGEPQGTSSSTITYDDGSGDEGGYRGGSGEESQYPASGYAPDSNGTYMSGSGDWVTPDDGGEYYFGDGGTPSSGGTDATIAERGPEAVITTKAPSRYVAIGREVVNGLGNLVSGGRMQRQASTPPTTQQPVPQAPQSLSSKIANGVQGVLTGHRYLADGGNVGDPGQTSLLNAMSTPQGAPSTTASQVTGGNYSGGDNYKPSTSAPTQTSGGVDQPYNPPYSSGGPMQPPSGMRGDGSSVPGNEPGGAQGRYGWQGPASQQMANAGHSNVKQAAPQQQFQQPQQRSMRVFTQPTNVKLGGNGTTDTVVPLNPGPNAKILPSQMGMGGGQPQGQYRQSGPQQPPQTGYPQLQAGSSTTFTGAPPTPGAIAAANSTPGQKSAYSWLNGGSSQPTPDQVSQGASLRSSAYGQQPPPQAAQQSQPRMPSRYRPATGPKGMVGPQMRPMKSKQYAA